MKYIALFFFSMHCFYVTRDFAHFILFPLLPPHCKLCKGRISWANPAGCPVEVRVMATKYVHTKCVKNSF